MTPSARLEAAIEILGALQTTAPPADRLLRDLVPPRRRPLRRRLVPAPPLGRIEGSSRGRRARVRYPAPSRLLCLAYAKRGAAVAGDGVLAQGRRERGVDPGAVPRRELWSGGAERGGTREASAAAGRRAAAC